MRKSLFLRNAIFLLAAVAPAATYAQFQDPSPDELKMTSDPKAPDAPAVYLYREQVTKEYERVQTFYARIKVLTDKGKELATVKVPFLPEYMSVDKVEGRTIHSDGTVIPLSVKPEKLLDFKDEYFQEDNLVFTLPSVDIGSILEYRILLRYRYGVPAPRWDIQSPYFIHAEHFFFSSDKTNGCPVDDHRNFLCRLGYLIAPQNTPVSVQRKGNDYTADLTDVPPEPKEDWMPPMNTLRWRVQFYDTYATSLKEFWEKEPKYWSWDTNDFAKVTETIKKAASGLVDAGDTDEQKARKIYAAVMKLENTDFTHVKSEAERKKEKLKQIRTVEDVWKNQSGPGNSIALLYVALARAAGLKVWPMEVVDRNNAIFDYGDPDSDQLEDYIAIVEIGGKEIYVDPSQKVCPFGVLHWAHAYSRGFRESAAGPSVADTPAMTYVNNQLQRTAEVTLNADGSFTGVGRIAMNGAESIYWRQQALEKGPDALKKDFEDALNADLPEGVTATFDHFVGLDDYEAKLVVIVKLSGSLGVPAGKRLIVPGLLFEARSKHPFVAEDKRQAPVDVHYPVMESDHVIYHLPLGYTVESSPNTADVTWPGSALLRISSESKEDRLEVARVFGRNFTVLGPESYNNLHDFYLKLAAADQQQIVLLRAAATTAKGN